jgi:phosphotransferase system  glucose/maltose/N-acetylglucosamine-specific IIC component
MKKAVIICVVGLFYKFIYFNIYLVKLSKKTTKKQNKKKKKKKKPPLPPKKRKNKKQKQKQINQKDIKSKQNVY